MPGRPGNWPCPGWYGIYWPGGCCGVSCVLESDRFLKKPSKPEGFRPWTATGACWGGDAYPGCPRPAAGPDLWRSGAGCPLREADCGPGPGGGVWTEPGWEPGPGGAAFIACGCGPGPAGRTAP